MKILFNKTTPEELKKLFPVISYDDYEFLQEQEMLLDPKAYADLIRNKFLTLGDYKIPEALIEVLYDKSISQEQLKVQEAVAEKFIFSEPVVDILMAGIEMKKNVILYGRGGHGKSEITDLVLKTLYDMGYLKEEPFVQAFGDGMTEDKLFGGMNIKKYKEEGILEYLPEFSFMNYEVVVFEEIFDAPPQVLLSLKDIMTSKQFRQGHQRFPVRTKLIIGLTNKSKEEFSEKSDSLKALAERFPLTMKVEWDRYNKTNFLKLFEKVLPAKLRTQNADKLSTLADIIDLNNANGATFVSPRTAIWAAEIYCKDKPLDYISEIDKAVIAEYNKKVKDEKISAIQKQFLRKLEEYIDKNELDLTPESEEFLNALNQIDIDAGGKPMDIKALTKDIDGQKDIKLTKIKYLLEVINRTQFTEVNFKVSTSLKKRLNHLENNLKS